MPVIVTKLISETPLQAIDRYRRTQSRDLPAGRQGETERSDNLKIGYAGRLDPMAEGLLLLLVGDENKERKKYEALDKEYEFEVLFGIETDSYDVMGMITRNELGIKPCLPAGRNYELRALVKKELKKMVGTWEQEYPPYSSATVGGKPLYWWTRQNRLHEIEIPKKKVEISELEVIKWREVGAADLAQTAIQRIQNVRGDFRQKEIIEGWRLIAAAQTNVCYPVARCRVLCSSGTYVRGLAHSLGRALNTPTLAYSIKRVRIGPYKV